MSGPLSLTGGRERAGVRAGLQRTSRCTACVQRPHPASSPGDSASFSLERRGNQASNHLAHPATHHTRLTLCVRSKYAIMPFHVSHRSIRGGLFIARSPHDPLAERDRRARVQKKWPQSGRKVSYLFGSQIVSPCLPEDCAGERGGGGLWPATFSSGWAGPLRGGNLALQCRRLGVLARFFARPR